MPLGIPSYHNNILTGNKEKDSFHGLNAEIAHEGACLA